MVDIEIPGVLEPGESETGEEGWGSGIGTSFSVDM